MSMLAGEQRIMTHFHKITKSAEPRTGIQFVGLSSETHFIECHANGNVSENEPGHGQRLRSL